MKILVTGGLGFIGSNFILQFLNKYPKSKIINVDAELPGSSHMNLIQLKNDNYSFVKGNITNAKLMDKLVSKIDMVFNFAADSYVDRSVSNPKPFVDSNFIGVYTILEAIKKHRKRLVQISTDEVFGSLKSGSANEKYLLNPSSPYASTKASAELLINSYVKTYNCEATITRCTNNYGPRQFPEKLIPRVIVLALKDKKIPIYGDGKNIRDWIFVDDHCEGVMKVAIKGKVGESYNISSSNEIDNLTIVRKILEILGKPSDLIYHVEDRPGHDFRYSLDSTKIRKELGWRPSHSFEKGIEYTIKWYVENKERWQKLSSKILDPTPWKRR